MRYLGITILTVAAALAAGCSSTHPAAPSPPPSSLPSASPSTTAPSTTAPSTTASSATAAPTTAAAAGHATSCTPNDIQISLGHGGAGSGHLGAAILFTNHSSHACQISGYPNALPDGGLTVGIKQTPSGYLGGLASPSATQPRIDLAPGQTASALVEGTDNPVPATAHCPTAAGTLDLWLPGYSSPVAPTRIANPAGTCSAIQIHPVVPGATGRQQP